MLEKFEYLNFIRGKSSHNIFLWMFLLEQLGERAKHFKSPGDCYELRPYVGQKEKFYMKFI